MPFPVYPLTAIHADGTTIVAANPNEATAFNRLRPGPFHVRGTLHLAGVFQGQPHYREWTERHDWIVRDGHGAAVLHEDLPRTDVPPRGRPRGRVAAVRHAAERGLPIPGTGRRRRYSSGYRGFRCNVSARADEAALASDLADWGLEGLRVGRARSRLLPQVWDDVGYRCGRRGGWKSHRAAQWAER